MSGTDKPGEDSLPGNRKFEKIILLQPLAVSECDAAAMLGISKAHFRGLVKKKRIGPQPVSGFGDRILYSYEELVRWATAGFPWEDEWRTRGDGG